MEQHHSRFVKCRLYIPEFYSFHCIITFWYMTDIKLIIYPNNRFYVYGISKMQSSNLKSLSLQLDVVDQIFQIIKFIRSNYLSSKNQRFTPSGCKDKWIRKFEFVGKLNSCMEAEINQTTLWKSLVRGIWSSLSVLLTSLGVFKMMSEQFKSRHFL